MDDRPRRSTPMFEPVRAACEPTVAELCRGRRGFVRCPRVGAFARWHLNER
jgi:hypothetical protein